LDYPKQDHHDGDNQQDMDNAATSVAQKAYCPYDDQYDCDDIKEISHFFFVFG